MLLANVNVNANVFPLVISLISNCLLSHDVLTMLAYSIVRMRAIVVVVVAVAAGKVQLAARVCLSSLVRLN